MNKSDMDLSRRERQIMEIIYSLGGATVSEVLSRLTDPPGYSAVRATMRILEEKGRLQHAKDGPRYVYRPTVPRTKVARAAIRNFLGAYFDGSLENAIASLLSVRKGRMRDADYARIMEMIRKAREEDR